MIFIYLKLMVDMMALPNSRKIHVSDFSLQYQLDGILRRSLLWKEPVRGWMV